MSTDETYDFKISDGGGEAHALFGEIDLHSPSMDTALGAEAHRLAWLECNAKGQEAQRAYIAFNGEWATSHSQADYGSRADWESALNLACRPLENVVKACTRDSVAALTAYRNAQRAGFATPGARTAFREAYLAADTAAVDAWAILDAALETRESLGRFVVQPDRSTQVGRGHWRNASALAGAMSPKAEHQRTAMATVVMVAPRNIVRDALAAETTVPAKAKR